MPYICLANANIPDGVLQVLDLLPNSSQAIPSLSPPGESRYLSRAKTGTGVLNATGTMIPSYIDGLNAYLVDNVEPGGMERASGTITMNSPVHGDTIVIGGPARGTVSIVGVVTQGEQVIVNGVAYTARDAPTTTAQFQSSAGPSTATQIAASLVASIIAQQGPAGTVEMTVTAANVLGVVTITALTAGAVGQYALSDTSVGIDSVSPMACGIFTATANFATGTVTIGGAVANDATFVLNALTYTAKAAPALPTEFTSNPGGGGEVATALSLQLAIVANQAAIVTAAAPVGAAFSITANAVRGLAGEYAMTTSSGGITLPAGDKLTVTPVNAGLRQFEAVAQSSSNTLSAVSLQAALADATAVTGGVAAMRRANANAYVTAPVPGTAVVTVSANYVTGARILYGFLGDLVLTSSSARIVASGTRMTRTTPIWTAAVQAATSAAILARVDAGLPLALADLNTLLLAQAGANLVTTGLTISIDSRSKGTVADVLAILAGRTYRTPQTTLSGTTLYYMNPTNPTFQWNAAEYNTVLGRADTTWLTGLATYGAFTRPVLVNDTIMSSGEWKPATIGGDTENREVAGIRHTYNVDAVAASLSGGALDALNGAMDLWPDSQTIPHFPYNLPGFTTYSRTTVSRLVTVYADDGTVLT